MLELEILADRPDWPEVGIRVDGENPFAAVAPEWRGFDPDDILGPVLVPDDAGRRVAVYRCSCGEPGCGVIAPYIVPSPDRRLISWVDFRDYTGIFNGPRADVSADGRPWQLPDLHFDRTQYLAEVRRATADRSWETPRRATARLLKERLASVPYLRWVSPAWDAEGVELSIEQPGRRQQVLQLASTEPTPSRAADDMARRLLACPPEEWSRRFSSRRGGSSAGS